MHHVLSEQPVPAASPQFQRKSERSGNIAHLLRGKGRDGGAQSPFWNCLDVIAIDRAIAWQAIINRQCHFARDSANTGRYRRNGHLSQTGDNRVSGQYEDRSAFVRRGKSVPANLTSTHYVVLQGASPQA